MKRTVAQVGEIQLLELLAPYFAARVDNLLVAVGDDCAVFQPCPQRPLQVITTDLLVEGTHFLQSPETDWHSLGRRAVVANLSDLASMGANPAWLLTSIAVPPDLPVDHLLALYEGMYLEARTHGAGIAGGDTVRGQNVTIAITAVGNKSAADAPCTRASARPGYFIYVSGNLGGCRAGLELQLRPELCQSLSAAVTESLIRRQQLPQPRIALGRFLALHVEDPCVIDVSDGLSSELQRISQASAVGLEVALAKLPLHPGVNDFARLHNRSAQEFALFSGEEYELLFTCALNEATLRERLTSEGVDTAVTCIGRAGEGAGITYLAPDGRVCHPQDETFQHFKESPVAHS